jgi:hypothetical protein
MKALALEIQGDDLWQTIQLAAAGNALNWARLSM